MYAVFDGHAGAYVAGLAEKRLPGLVAAHSRYAGSSAADLTAAVEESLARIEADFLAEYDAATVPRAPSLHGGSTACIAVQRGRQLVVTNIGDSRAVLCRGGEAVAVSEDHSPAVEVTRIDAAGGWVSVSRETRFKTKATEVDPFTRAALDSVVFDSSRVCGELGVSRALGDAAYKGGRHTAIASDWTPPAGRAPKPITADLVVATPTSVTVELTPADDFLLVACDGVWEVLTSAQAVGLALESLRAGSTAANIGSRLVKVALELGSEDNISVVVVILRGRLPPAE